MHEERSESVLDADVRVERNIMLSLLLDSPGRALWWSREELALELQESQLAVEDALARLRRTGLVLRCGDCAAASRAARRLEELDMVRV